MIKFKNLETTYICQLGKPQNRAVLEGFVDRRDKSCAELARYYMAIINMLQGTKAWGVSGVNKMINELTDKVNATRLKAKKGKTTAYAHANQLLFKIDHFAEQEAEARYCGNYKLHQLLTAEEIQELIDLDEPNVAEEITKK